MRTSFAFILLMLPLLFGCMRLEVVGDAASLELASGSIDFGTVVMNSSQRSMLSVYNAGDTDASGLNWSGNSADFGIVAPETIETSKTMCGGTIPPKATCHFAIDFIPLSAQSLETTLTLNFQTGSGWQSKSLLLKGVGVPPPQAVVAGPIISPVDFGVSTLGLSNTQTITLQNTGNAPATAVVPQSLNSHFRFLGGSYPGTLGTCGALLAAGNSCTMVMEFAPSITGILNGSLTMQFHDGISTSSLNISLRGTGAAPPEGFLGFTSGLSHNVGSTDITVSMQSTLTLVNSGGAPVTGILASGLSTPFQYIGGNYPGMGGDCDGDLAIGESCTIKISFLSAAQGHFSNSFSIQYHNGVTTVSTSIAINATATPFDPATLTFSPASPYTFIATDVDTSRTALITVTNNGEMSASSLTMSASSPFTFDGGSYPGTNGTCGNSLAVGQSCSVEINFTPVTGGSISKSMSAQYGDGYAPATQSYTLQGTGIPGGGLDSSFGTGGMVRLDYSHNDQLKSLDLQTNSKIIFAGHETPAASEDFSVVRLNTDGSLDTGYAAGGRQCHDLLSNSLDQIFHSRLQSDGKLVVTGLSNNDVATVRYNTDGSVDSGFDLLGLSRITIPLLSSAAGYHVAIQGNGKVLVVGQAFPASGDTKSFALRLSAGGLIDLLAFGLTGIRTYDLGTGSEALNAVKIDSNNKAITGGFITVSGKKRVIVVRLDTDGTLDTGYATSGKFTYDFSGATRDSELLNLVLQGDDKAIGVGYNNNGSSEEMLVFRLNPNGTLDASFGTAGVVKLDVSTGQDRAHSVAIDANGKILIAGQYLEGSNKGLALVRSSASGVPDPKFGANGVVKTTITNEALWAKDIKVQADGKIVVGGTAQAGSNMDYMVIRYLP